MLHAQAAVAAGSLLVVATDVVQATNDKQQVEPMLGKLAALPQDLGTPDTLLADNGYFSEAKINACTAAGIDPVIAMGRDKRHPSLDERHAKPPAAPVDPTPLEAMAHRLQTQEGKALYAGQRHRHGLPRAGRRHPAAAERPSARPGPVLPHRPQGHSS